MPHLGKTSYFLLSCAYLICFLIESCCTNQFGKSTKWKQLNLSYIWCYEPSYRVFPILQLHRFESGACILCLLMLVSFNTLKTSYFIGCLAEFGLNFYVGIIHIGCLYIKGHLEAVGFVWEASFVCCQYKGNQNGEPLWKKKREGKSAKSEYPHCN